jgi:transcriptional regulator with XRE-family HTH domain
MSGDHADFAKIAFGRVLRTYRFQKQYSQKRLSFESGVQRNFISLIEIGQNQPTITTIYKLAHALGVSAIDLIRATDEECRSQAS